MASARAARSAAFCSANSAAAAARSTARARLFSSGRALCAKVGKVRTRYRLVAGRLGWLYDAALYLEFNADSFWRLTQEKLN